MLFTTFSNILFLFLQRLKSTPEKVDKCSKDCNRFVKKMTYILYCTYSSTTEKEIMRIHHFSKFIFFIPKITDRRLRTFLRRLPAPAIFWELADFGELEFPKLGQSRPLFNPLTHGIGQNCQSKV